MLGRLARYLRLLGYDVVYPDPCSDAGLIALARREGRILLTRDRGILQRAGPASGSPRVVLIMSDGVMEQIAQLTLEGWIGAPGNPRCVSCNLPLSYISAHEARHLVPPYTLAAQTNFLYCAGCNSVLWEGSHLERFRERLCRNLTLPH